MSGRLVIMGSGETAPTMIKVHRRLLESIPDGDAVLVDTPYAFQENADDITARAQHYFRTSVGREVAAVRWPDADLADLERERALARLRTARWIFAGPGSPTFALSRWRSTPVPGLLRDTVSGGGTVLFASAAALTLGSHTVPVYEIYKAGVQPHWESGLDLVSELAGLPAVVIPHYDNAEGGHHDTRYCYLGERRLSALEPDLPADAFVLGVDEHTAVILDLGTGTASVLGNGRLTLRRAGRSLTFPAGSELTLSDLGRLIDSAPGAGSGAGAGAGAGAGSRRNLPDGLAQQAEAPVALSLRVAADECRERFTAALADRDVDAAVAAVLDLEQAITDWASDTLSSDDGDHAHGVLRSMMVDLGDLARHGAADPATRIRPYVDLLIAIRGRARDGRDFATGDEIRDCLVSAGVEVRDTPTGPQWSLLPPKDPAP